ncbi:hypothetical protein QTP88_021240 [Uroleucon formosanum]
MDNMEDVANISSAKKNPRGKFVGTAQKTIIINVYKDKIKQQLDNPEMPKLSFRDLIVAISRTTGIGQRTIQTTLGEYKKEGTVSSPNKRKVPTVPKMLIAINEDDSLPNLKRMYFQLILKDLQFEYVKKNRNSALLEREDLISLRRNYLLKIKHYRAQNRPIYYLDETWVNAGETHSRTWVDTTVASTRDAHLRGLTTGQKAPSGKGKRLIVLHIGSSDDFVPGGLLCFESKTNSAYYHDEMNGDTFYEWFVKTLPLLKPNAIIVMDNASYHSVKKQKIPVRSWKKQAIIDWLESKDVIVTYPIVKNDLMKKVYKIKKHHDTYVIDET